MSRVFFEKVIQVITFVVFKFLHKVYNNWESHLDPLFVTDIQVCRDAFALLQHRIVPPCSVLKLMAT